MSLTPYDTGERLEPHPWVTSTAGLTRDNADEFGKVDFKNDAAENILTLYIERNEDGSHTLHMENITGELKVEVDRS